MNQTEFNNLLDKYLEKIDIVINETQKEQFHKYMDLLIEWNKKINLTAIVEPEEIILKHFIDSVTISKYINQDDKTIDIGTGAGFPGIPLKIIRPELKIELLDSLNKRINFLNIVVDELKLKNIECIHSRVEEFAKNKKNREKYDIVTSRAVANLNVLVEYMIPLIKIGGRCICMKGPNIEEEIAKSQNAIKILGGEIEKVEEFTLPETDIKRTIIIIKKVKNTPSKYPRKPGAPSKEPIM
jgi:16S rRNA (guanine527-N7)-methyltransferase